MKKAISLVLCFVMTLSLFLTFEPPKAKAADTLLSHMTDKHPRLQVTDFDVIREKIKTDPFCAALYQGVKNRADVLLTQPAFSYKVADLEKNGHSRVIPSASIVPIFYTLALVTEIENDERYLEKLWQEAETAINLPNWNTGHWLDTAQMIQSVSIAYDWCYHRWTDEQRQALENGIKTHGLEQSIREYEGNPRWYQWHSSFTGEVMENNWNMVCNNGVIFGAIALADVEPDLCETLLNNAIRSISDGFLEWAPDGGYPEGSAYWKFALTNLIASNSAIEAAFGGFEGLPELEAPHQYDFLKAPGVGDAGDYATYLKGVIGSANYGDATVGNINSSALVYIASRLNKPEYLKHFMNLHKDPASYEAYERSDDLVQALLYYKPMDLTVDNVSLDKSFDLGLSTMRNSWTTNKDTVFVSVKGAYNKGPHQHWDMGSFAIDALGQRFIKLPGSITYGWPGWTSGQQYYIRRPEGNNTIVINPDQSLGQTEQSEKMILMSRGSSTDEGYVVYDLSPAYVEYAESLKRGVKLFDDRSRVLVQDEIVFSEEENDVWWFAKTDGEISLADDGKSAVITLKGEKMFARILSPSSGTFIMKDEAPLPESPNPTIQPANYGTKLAINLTEEEEETTIAVEFIPLAGNQAPPDDKTKIIPLEEWSVKGKEENRLSSITDGVVAMQQDRSLAYANGIKTLIDSKNPDIRPVLRNDRTMVPLRFVSEAFDGVVVWSDASQEVSIRCDYKDLKIKIGESTMLADGKEVPIDSPAFVENGRTFVPLRAISEAMGKYVYEDNGVVIIANSENPFEDYPELYDELKSLLKYDVEVNGEKAFYFHPEKTQYYIFKSDVNKVKVDIAGGQVIEKEGADEIVVNLDGVDYTFTFVEDEYEITEPYIKEIRMYCTEEEEYIPEGGAESKHIPVISASDTNNDGNLGKNAFDNYIKTRWSGKTQASEDDGGVAAAYLTADFGEVKKVTHMHAAFYSGGRQEIFDIQTSVDGQEWKTVYSGRSNGLTTEMQLFELEPSEAQYVRYVGYGNTKNSYNSVTEIRFYSSLEDAQEDAQDWEELEVTSAYQYITGELYNFRVEALMSDNTVVKLNNSQVQFGVDNEDNASIDENGVLEIYEPETINVFAYVNKGRIQRTTKYNLTAEQKGDNMKKLSVLLLVLLMISQTALAASYSAYPLGDGRVEITGTKNADKETTFLIKSLDGTKLIDVGQVGTGEEEFSKILFIKTPDGNIYNVEIGEETVPVKNVSPAQALLELESASASEFKNVLMPYNKIFNADVSLITPVYDKENAYNLLAEKDFSAPENVATEYADVIGDVINNEKENALNLISQSKSGEAISKYNGHFALDMTKYSEISNKTLVHICLDGNVYSDGGFEAAFADAIILAKINEASGEAFINLVREHQSEIGMDLSEGANIAPIVFNKVDALTLTSFASFKKAFTEEISLNKLNLATEETVQSVLEAENAVLGILDTHGYSSLSADNKLKVCQAMARTDFDTIAEAKSEFALLIQRANAGTPVVPSNPSTKPGNNYVVSGGGGVSGGAPATTPQQGSSPFTDLSSSHWGYSAVISLYSQGIVSGTSATTFEPERQVTREEFVKMLVGTFGMYNANAQNVFADVSADDWCASYVASAYEKGLTTGKGDGSFGKGEFLTRQDMAVLADRCAKIANLKLSGLNSNSFTDEGSFAPYAKDSIYNLAKAGIINGIGDGLFSPASHCTRAMAAKVCNELLKLYRGGAY